MATRTISKWVVLKHVVSAIGAALAWVGCGRDQSDLTAPNSRVPSLSQQAGSGQKFVSFDYPGATNTSAKSISPSGGILGQYVGTDGKPHGFLLSGGTFTAVPEVPSAVRSDPNRLNARGTVVGTYYLELPPLKEYAYQLTGGTFTTITYPDPSISLAGWGVNDNGTVVGPKFIEGDFLDAHGYVFTNNTFTLFDVPGAMGTFPTSINDDASIVGTYVNSDFGFHGFLRSGGTFRTIDFPNSTFNWVNGINTEGDIVGFYDDQDGGEHGVVRSNGALESIDVPGAIATHCLAINAQGDVVGDYVTPDGNTHGFLLACATCSLR